MIRNVYFFLFTIFITSISTECMTPNLGPDTTIQFLSLPVEIICHYIIRYLKRTDQLKLRAYTKIHSDLKI